MGRHRHNGARAVSHHHIVGDPDRDAFVVDRVDGVSADKDAGFLLLSGHSFNLTLAGGLEFVLLHFFQELRRRQFVHQRVLRGQHHKGRAPERVGPGGEDDDRIILLGEECHVGSFAPPDPVFLHGTDALRPIYFRVIQQFVGIVSDAEEPLLQFLLHDQCAAALAVAVLPPDLLAG